MIEDPYNRGLEVRREVLGDAHVDREAALRNGLSPAELGEVLLQTAIYCGVPAGNSAFRIAQGVLAEEDAT